MVEGGGCPGNKNICTDGNSCHRCNGDRKCSRLADGIVEKSSGVDFVIVYGGMGRLASQKSVYFEKNYANAKAAGLKVGAYWYSYAKSAAEAELEAKACIEAIGGKTYDLPIFLDMEEPSQLALGKSVCSGITKAFCNYLIKKGIRAGLYISYSPLMDCISEDVRKAYPMWIAQYYSVCQYSNAAIWQYTDKGTVPGIGVYVDMNYLYDEKLISGSKPAQSKLAQSKSKPDEISQETSSSKVDFKVKITSSNGVNIRSGASTSYKILGAVPYGCEVRISRQTSGGGYTWGLTTYAREIGWIALEFTKKVPKKTVSELAYEVIGGKWAAGDERKKLLTEAGYNYDEVQKKVNEIMSKM